MHCFPRGYGNCCQRLQKMQYLQYIFTGLFISLSGSLPLGNLNIAAMQIAAGERYKKAVLFALGVTAVEMGYLGITLFAVNKVIAGGTVLAILRIATPALLLVMAAGSFAAVKQKEQQSVIINNKANKLLLGVLMSALNPMQFPFWAGWTTYLLGRSLLHASNTAYAVFTLGAGAGTFIALMAFIVAGIKLSPLMERNKKLVNLITGCMFLAMALIQIRELLQS